MCIFFLFIIKQVAFLQEGKTLENSFTLTYPLQSTLMEVGALKPFHHSHPTRNNQKFVLAIVVLFLCKAKARRVSSWVWLKVWNVLAPVEFCWWTTHVQHGKNQTGLNKWGVSNTGFVIVKVSRCGCCPSVTDRTSESVTRSPVCVPPRTPHITRYKHNQHYT